MKRLLLVALLVALLPAPAEAREDDPRWVFYSRDRTSYTSPWYAGAHRIMIHYGCTRAPYYAPDPRCTDDRGFHHGIDMAIPCGTRLFAGIGGWVVGRGDLGPAYGVRPVRLRNHRRGIDVVIGHTRRVFVQPGDYVAPGRLIARVSDSAAPDGCHLHFEVRDKGGSLSTARPPRQLLGLQAR